MKIIDVIANFQDGFFALFTCDMKRYKLAQFTYKVWKHTTISGYRLRRGKSHFN